MQTPAWRHGRRFALHFGIALALLSTHLSGQNSSQTAAPPMDAEFIHGTVESLITVVRREYVDPDVAIGVEKSMRQGLTEGRYKGVATPEEFATILTRDLFDGSHDQHLFVSVVPETAAGLSPQASVKAIRKESGHRSNFGIQRVEVLRGNVGFLNLTAFYHPEEARDAFFAAMRVVAHADALILDLRANGGGSPDMVALVASYMFDRSGLALFEVVPRSGRRVKRYRTKSIPVPERNGSRPLYVLTSGRTWSGGEGLAFLLQEHHRAEVIGETTAGAANPGRPYHLNARFDVNVPNGRIRTAVLGRNWEGAGVLPDVVTPASQALHVAHARALRRLLDLVPTGSRHEKLEHELRGLESQPSDDGGRHPSQPQFK